MQKTTLIIAGGGTGGHVYAGIAVAEAWKNKFPENGEVFFIGAQGGMEEKILGATSWPHFFLKIGSLNRVTLKRKLKTFFQLPRSLWISAQILLRLRPQAILGVGGYASGPVLLMAFFLAPILKAKTAILEQNTVSGLTNRILGKLVDTVFLAFENFSGQFLSQKILVSGNPVRSVIVPMASSSENVFSILVFGGSQGALGLNTAVMGALKNLAKKSANFRVTHQTGKQDFERVSQFYKNEGFPFQPTVYIDDMKSHYEKAHLVICRAGSSTLSELATAGRASILVPLPTAADNHQETNAQLFVKARAARLFLQYRDTPEQLSQWIEEFMNHREILTEMERNVRCFYRPHAAETIVQHLSQKI